MDRQAPKSKDAVTQPPDSDPSDDWTPPGGEWTPPNWAPPDPQQEQPWGQQSQWAPESSRWAPAMRPGAVPLRPLSVGEILDGAITYIRRNPLATLGTAAVLTALSGVIQAVILAVTANRLTAQLTDFANGSVSSADLQQVAMSLGQGLGLLLGSVIGWAIGILATGMLTVMMGAAVLGRRLDIASALRVFAPRLPGLILLTLMVSLAVFAIVFVGIAAGIALGFLLGLPGVVVGVFVALGAVVAAIWLYVRLLLAPVVLILENVGPVAAWRRSTTLVRGSWWRIFGISLLATVIATTIAAIVSVPFQAVAGVMAPTDGEPTALFWALITIGSVVAGIITLPFTAGVVSLLYVDRRMRREGLDLILQSQAGSASSEDASGAPLDSDDWIAAFRRKQP